jgi:hypothetical protein
MGSWREPKGVRDYSCPDATHGRVGYAKRGRLAGAGQWWLDVWGGLDANAGRARRQRSPGHVASIGQRGPSAPLAIAASVGVISRPSAMASADATLDQFSNFIQVHTLVLIEIMHGNVSVSVRFGFVWLQ